LIYASERVGRGVLCGPPARVYMRCYHARRNKIVGEHVEKHKGRSIMVYKRNRK